MMMHSWGHQHMHMPLMMHPHGSSSGSPPGGYMGGSSSGRGNWPLNNKAGGYGGSYSNGRQGGGRGGAQGGRGGRARRHIVLNTNPGERSGPSSGWLCSHGRTLQESKQPAPCLTYTQLHVQA